MPPTIKLAEIGKSCAGEVSVKARTLKTAAAFPGPEWRSEEALGLS
jgi:hypothetical protein